MPAGGESGKKIVLAEKPVCRGFHSHQIFRLSTDAAQDTEYALDEKRRFHDLSIGKVGEIINMGHVVTFELESRALRTELAHAPFHLRERVREDEILRAFEIW